MALLNSQKPLCDPKLVLEKLAGVQEQLSAISEKADGYRAMQETFHVPVSEFRELDDTAAQFDANMEKWTKLDVWNESVYNWKAADFRTLDVEELIKEVFECMRECLPPGK